VDGIQQGCQCFDDWTADRTTRYPAENERPFRTQARCGPAVQQDNQMGCYSFKDR